jgi:hypothetical protein
MAVLSDPDRLSGYQDFLRLRNEARDPVEVTKPNVLLAFNALDDFMSANTTAINTAIPQPARSALTTQQKARLLIAVLERRYLSGL